MMKLSRRGGAWLAALTLGGVLYALPSGVAQACDDDYRQPVGWGQQYPAPGPNVVVVEPGYRDDRYDHWRHERAARRYWYWRGREHDHRRGGRHWD